MYTWTFLKLHDWENNYSLNFVLSYDKYADVLVEQWRQ